MLTGHQAAEAIADLCKRKRHLASPANRNEYLVCQDCREFQDELRAKDRDARPALHTTSVHLVIDPVSGRIGAKMDAGEAAQAAMEIGGVVVSWPVSADFRPAEQQKTG